MSDDGTTPPEFPAADDPRIGVAGSAPDRAEARYRSIFNNAREGILQTTEEGRIMAANPALARMFGYASVDEFLRAVPDVSELYVEGAKRGELQRLLREHGAVVDFEVQMRRRDGALIWTASNIQLVHDEHGAPHYEGRMEEITDRKRADAVVQEAANRVVRRRRFAIWVEVALLGGLTVVVYELAAHFNRFEALAGWILGNRGPRQTNALVVSGAGLFFGLLVFGFRRWRESVAEITSQRQTQNALRVLRDELDFRVKQRTAELHAANLALRAEAAERARAEVVLRSQSAALTAAANAIVITDRAGTIVWVNPAFSALTGYPAVEAVGKNPRDLVKSGQHGSTVYEQLWATILDGRVWRGELINRRRDGSLYPEEQTITPVRDAHGEITHFIAIKQDLTERNLVDQMVQATRRQFQAVFEQAAVGMVIAEGARGRFINVNRRFCEMVGYTSSELRQLSSHDITHEDDLAADTDRLRQISEGTIREFSREKRYRRKDGSYVWARAFVAPLDPEEAKPTLRIGVIEDISTRKEAEQALREQNEILANSHEAVMIVNLANQVTWWNRGAQEIFGWTAAEALGRPPEQVIGVDELGAVPTLRTAVEREGFWNGELRARARDGRKLIVDCRVTLVRDEAGQPRARLNFLADITEKKLLEEKFLHAQRLESIGMLAAGIAHDLNNVLAPIVFAAPMLRENLVGERDRKILDTLERSAARGSGLVKQILGFVHSTTGQFRTVQVKHLARDIVAMLEETFPKSIELEHNIPSDLWPVRGDPTQIHQVLLNLCVNARDAMPQGGTLRIVVANLRLDAAEAAAMPGARPGVWLLIEVADTGTGIPADLLARIWDPFFTTKSADKGTGLGLSTVRGIIASHLGFVTVDTHPGQGTTFRVFLPATEEQPPGQGGAPIFAAPIGQGELVLVVDDETSIRETIAAILTKQKYRVLSASDGVEALERFGAQSTEIALVITDVDMPRLDGTALTRALTAVRADLPVVAMSGLARAETEQSQIETAKQLAHAFLLKPFTSESLLATVHGLLHPPATTPTP